MRNLSYLVFRKELTKYKLQIIPIIFLVDGQWSDYGAVSACSKTCGDGTKTKTRTCTNPAPQNGGKDCVGDATHTENCKVKDCPSN